MSNSLRVLVVEDSVDDTFFIVRELQRGGFQVDFERVENRASMEAALDVGAWDLVISDYRMPQFDGATALAVYQKAGREIPFIMVTGALSAEQAVEIIKAGAHDCINKDRLDRLVPAVKRELDAARDRQIRRRTEQTTAYLASIVENCEDAVIGRTLEGTVVTWNAGAERLYGYSASEMIGKPISTLYANYRPDDAAEMSDKILSGEHLQQYDTVRVCKNGKPVEVSLTVSPIKDANGRVIGASVLARNITQRKQEESERLALIRELTAALSHVRVPSAAP
jgi:PAS domain S-box-containing protein